MSPRSSLAAWRRYGRRSVIVSDGPECCAPASPASPARGWKAAVAALGLAGAVAGIAAGSQVHPSAGAHASVSVALTCPRKVCGVNHNQVLL